MATEWATSMSVTVTIPSADADDTFNAALDELTAKVREYARPHQYAAVAVDLVTALRNTRAQAMHEGRDSGYAIDRVLLMVIEDYIFQIEAEWA